MPGNRAVVVTRPGAQQSEFGSKHPQPRARLGVVIGVIDLQGKQSGNGHRRGYVVGHHRSAFDRARVGENGHATSSAHQPDRFEGTKRVLVDVRPASRTDPFIGESTGHIRYDARLDKRARDVRPPDGAAVGDLAHPLGSDRYAEPLQLCDHVVRAARTIGAQSFARRRKLRLVGIEEIRQQVQRHPALTDEHLTGDLRTGHQSEPGGQRCSGRCMTGDGVVVGQRNNVEPGFGGAPDHIGRRLRPVRRGRVRVQINAHAPGSLVYSRCRLMLTAGANPSRPARVFDGGTDMELAALAEFARDDARARGVDYADVRAISSDSESIDVRDGDVQGVGRQSSRGVGIRALVNGAWGFAATNSSDEADVRRAVERAVDIAKASGTVQRDRVQLDQSPPPAGSYVTPHGRDPFDVPLAEKVELLLAATASGREVAGVSFVEATTDAWKDTTHFRSTEGGWFDQTVVQVGGGLRALALKAGDVQRRSYPNSFRGQFTCGGWEDIVALDLAGNAAATAREAVALLDAPDLPARERTLILESSQLALQVHESVGHATELDRILGMERAYAGTSFVDIADRGRLRYGSPLVTITADATTPGALGTFGYDDEGVAAGETTLIQDGLLVGFLTNRECAAVVGDVSNGTARADSWGSIPLIRMNNVSLQPRAGDLESIVADTADGVLLLTNKSWSIDDRRVNFQFSCEAAYEVHRGERGRLYKNPSYAGRTTEFWGACDAIGGTNDWRVWGVPNCGKGQPSQTARVGHGAATGRFHNITTGVGA